MKATPMAASTAAYTSAAPRQPRASSRKGAAKLVMPAPTLPAPKMPSAVPWRPGSNQAEV
jgi:hypothetical protein